MDLTSLHRGHVEELQRGVASAVDESGHPALVIHSGSAMKRTEADDAFWPLRPTPHFQHWLPLAEPGCLLVIEPGARPRLIRTLQPSYWEAPAPPDTGTSHSPHHPAGQRLESPCTEVIALRAPVLHFTDEPQFFHALLQQTIKVYP